VEAEVVGAVTDVFEHDTVPFDEGRQLNLTAADIGFPSRDVGDTTPRRD
jgi:hypothetical protein